MAYPFVPASAQYGARKGPVKAFVVHMAEGGGTVGFLSRPNPRGVSVHYVIEYTGRIVQMVRETDASGSINPNELRTDDDPAIYGATVRKAVMDSWDRDPNSAVISLEIEGFAKAGPNAAQHGSLRTLVADVRGRHPDMGLLGHRDFQAYKPCPGRLVHWDELGGHGPQGEDVEAIVPFSRPIPFQIAGVAKSWNANPPHEPLSDLTGIVSVDATVSIPLGTPHGPFVRVVTGSTGRRLIPVASGAFTPPVVDCDDVVTTELDKAATRAATAVRAR